MRSSCILLSALCIVLASCNGMFEGIYDEPVEEQQSEFGFKNTTMIPATEDMPAYSRGWIYVKTVDYMGWTYIDFDTQTVGSAGVYDEYEKDWDIAIHRYEVKTNGGMARKTKYSDFNVMLTDNHLEKGEYQEDVWTTDKVAIDLSGILDFDVKFLETYCSTVIDWVEVIYPPYPPTYKHNDNIFVIKLNNGNRVGIRLENYVNNNGVKAYLTLEYIYPFPLEEK